MRFVTLNLDVQDARVIRHTVARGIAGCGCRRGLAHDPCGSCQTLEAVLADLDRLLTRGVAGRPDAPRRQHATAELAPPRPSQSLAKPTGTHNLRLLPPVGEG